MPTLKDNDFMHDICKLHLEEPAKQRLMEHLERDIAFLQENNLMDYSALIGIHDVELASNEFDDPSASMPAVDIGGARHRGSAGEILASAGDGLGELFEERLFGGTHRAHSSHNPRENIGVGSYSSVGGGMPHDLCEALSDLSPPNSDDFDTLLASGAPDDNSNLTPPESPSDVSLRFQSFTGELSPNTEFYGFRGSPSLGRPVIYFIAIVDILTRYGMRKRTAQTYKTVKHGGANADQITTVRPDVYARRLLDFLGHCVE
ncbi:unnamed protein product [Mesocestoides corti]|uniref:PIPK domain-containing protein n=2 Tax=Mesocestoides corti TaxID=53468 RepID=A0A3P6HLN8_MESCO|nr:unnamed protein product [Mesocestoides corti]